MQSEPPNKRARIDSSIKCGNCAFTFKSNEELRIHKIIYCPEDNPEDNLEDNPDANESGYVFIPPKLCELTNSSNDVRKFLTNQNVKFCYLFI